MTWETSLAELVEERTGIRVAPRQLRLDVRRKIDARIRGLGLETPEAWVRLLARERSDNAELAWLVETVTVGYSYFFRDADQLAVAIEVLADLARGRRSRSHLQVWCAGCSTGQEAWSLAILAERAHLPIQILATDLNRSFVERAAQGLYPKKAGDQIPEALLGGFVPRSDAVEVRPDLAASVRFRVHNLVDAGPYPLALDGGRFDLVLCRNVFIYFSDLGRAQVATRFSRSIEANGWIFLGPGEVLESHDAPLVPCMWGRRLGYCRPGSNGSLLPAQSPAISQTPRHGAEDPLVEAARLVESGSEERAEQLLQRAASNLQEPRTWLALAHLRIRMHDFPRALDACARTLSLDPLFAGAHLAAGVIHRKLGDTVAAEGSFRQALFLDPHAWRAAILLAGVYGRQGRDREQRRLLRQAETSLQRSEPPEQTPIPSFGVDALDARPERVRAALAAMHSGGSAPDVG